MQNSSLSVFSKVARRAASVFTFALERPRVKDVKFEKQGASPEDGSVCRGGKGKKNPLRRECRSKEAYYFRGLSPHAPSRISTRRRVILDTLHRKNN